MKTITVKDRTWQRLTRIKADIMASDLDSVIAYLFYEKYDGEKEVDNEQ